MQSRRRKKKRGAHQRVHCTNYHVGNAVVRTFWEIRTKISETRQWSTSRCKLIAEKMSPRAPTYLNCQLARRKYLEHSQDILREGAHSGRGYYMPPDGCCKMQLSELFLGTPSCFPLCKSLATFCVPLLHNASTLLVL